MKRSPLNRYLSQFFVVKWFHRHDRRNHFDNWTSIWLYEMFLVCKLFALINTEIPIYGNSALDTPRTMASASSRYPVVEILDHLFLTSFFLASSLEQQLPFSSQEHEYLRHWCVFCVSKDPSLLCASDRWRCTYFYPMCVTGYLGMIRGTSHCNLETRIQSMRSLLELQIKIFIFVFTCAFCKHDAVARVRSFTDMFGSVYALNMFCPIFK